MYNFSINISDEIVSDFEGKLKLAGELLFSNIEIACKVDGKEICDLNGNEIEDFRNLLIDYNKRIVLLNLTSPAREPAVYRRLMRNAHLMGIENIGIPMDQIDRSAECINRLFDICKTGKAYGIGILLENSNKSVYSTEQEVNELYNRVKNEYTGLVFNPLEHARNKAHPFFHIYYNSRLKNDVRFLRVNDGLFNDGSPKLPGEGNAEIKELTSIMLSRSFKGYFSFTSYLDKMEIGDYRLVISSFKKLLKEM